MALHLAALRAQPRHRRGDCVRSAVCAAKARPAAKGPKPAAPSKQGSKAAKPQQVAGKSRDKAAQPGRDAATPLRNAPQQPAARPKQAAAAVVVQPDAAELKALPALAAGPPLSTQQLLSFARDGHVALRGLLSESEVTALAPGLLAELDARRVDALRTGVRVALGDEALVDDFGLPFDDADELEAAMTGASAPFLQVFNGCVASLLSVP